MPKKLDSLLLLAVDPSGLDLSKVTLAAGGLRDASGRLVRHARPVAEELLNQGPRARPASSQAAVAVSIAIAGFAIGIVASENREVIGRKTREAWSKVRRPSPGLSADNERSYDPLHADRTDHINELG